MLNSTSAVMLLIIWYSVSISALFLLLLPFRLWKLSQSSIKILPNQPRNIKGLISLTFLAIQVYTLALGAPRPADHVIPFFLSRVSSVVAALGVCMLSFVEHRRSLRPSTLLLLYLLASLAGAVFRATEPGHQFGSTENQILTHVRIFVELAFLVIESQDKKPILRDEYKHLSPEETAGILGKTIFWWINPILKEGNQKTLVAEDLPSTGEKLSSEVLRKKILRAWDERAKPEGTTTLPVVLLRCLTQPFISAIIPRLSLIIFRYSQALLISLTIRFVNRKETTAESISSGYWLVFAATVIYVGMAVSTAVYQHKLNRLKIMIRGALVGLIYHRSLNIQSGSDDGGNAVTLMSTDVGNLETVGAMVHETWAQLLEVVIGTCMLASQIGWLFPVPFVIILFCSQVSRYVATHLKSKQKNWSVATQDRISMTASMLSSAKSMKMLGMAEAMNSKIQGLRDHEIEMSKKLSWMMVAYNASANLLGIFAPVVTLTLFAILSKYKGDAKFDSDIVFTSTALLLMVTNPANMIMTIVPRAVASLANFERVQNYLLESSRQDSRFEIEKTRIRPTAPVELDCGSQVAAPAVLVDRITVHYSNNSLPTLRDINFKIDAGATIMCSGPVGCGKTTLAKAILGEVSPSTGSISVSTKRIGLCRQVPWLPSGSIREVICGSSVALDYDLLWYEKVITACDLRPDLKALPEDDETQIGSRGINLSGGQRQRVALARSIFARCDILVLDDPFSALDGKTEANIVQNLLGPQGLCKKMGIAVFMITHAAQYFPLADHIIVLGNTVIQTQGTWEELKGAPSQIMKITICEPERGQYVSGIQEQLNLQGQIRIVDDAAEDLTRKTGDLTVYGYYFKSVGITNVLLLVCATASNTVCLTFSQYWLKWWTEASSEQMWFYIGGYLLLTFIAWLGTCGVPWSASIRIASKSGFVLHQRLLNTIMGAPLSYYSENDIGVMLNRFGQDIQLIDTQLPTAVGIIMTQTFKLLMQATLLLCVQITLGVTLPFCIIVVYIVQRVYLRTSRQLRYIELESRSALFSSFLETVEGITTIRAFGWQNKFESDNVEALDKSQRPLYILFCLQRWLNLVFDFVIAGIAVGIIALSVALRGTTSGASVGVALNLILVANTTLLRLVESWTSLEISLGAIARLKSAVENTPSEDKLWENLCPTENWPSSGAIELENVTVSYNPNAVALKNISLKITAGQKLIICGRTGSGKSTFLLTLLHLMDLQSGSIKIDGIDLSRVPRSTLRQRCFIAVPQDTFIFTNASLRFNLDPSGSLPDDSLVIALEKTQLWRHFSGSETITSGNLLDLPMTSIPPLSTGQLQLLSLSRAILRRESSILGTYSDTPTTERKPILLLDEATSSLDPDTEALIQDVIQEEFTEKGHTVIIVAHRVSALTKGMRRGIDAVLQMRDGRIEKIGDVEDIVNLGSDVEERGS